MGATVEISALDSCVMSGEQMNLGKSSVEIELHGFVKEMEVTSVDVDIEGGCKHQDSFCSVEIFRSIEEPSGITVWYFLRRERQKSVNDIIAESLYDRYC